MESNFDNFWPKRNINVPNERNGGEDQQTLRSKG
jgi:hypothetical protein